MSAFPEARSDEALLRLAPYDPEAFAAFYRRHENAMLVFFLRRGANAEVAADLTAEVFAGALSSVRRFRPSRQPAVAWLYAIANHKLSSSNRRGRVEDRARARLGMEPIVLTDEALDAVEALADAERSTQVIEDLLDRLPAEQRLALRMRIVDEREYLDIASELSCSPAVVRQRVSRALKTLRREFAKEMS
jgi:RNA polymerase sigma factor (sigma-70 family)